MRIAEISQQLLSASRSAHSRGRSPLVILDLDGTLYDCTVRTWRILQEFAHRYAAQYPHLVEAIGRLRPGDVTYLVEDTLARAGLADPEVIDQVCTFWQQRFFTDDYVLHDLPTPGAVSFVRKLWEGGIVPIYLTGRPAPTMLVGTVRALQRDGFPVGTVDTRLVLKDDLETPDDEYKQRVVKQLEESGEVIGAFDNEPALCNGFRRSFSSAIIVHLDTTHSPGAPALDPRIEQVPNFL
jgi:hypothetical protein